MIEIERKKSKKEKTKNAIKASSKSDPILYNLNQRPAISNTRPQFHATKQTRR